jgi:lipopolysaccharide/colanic/teichoic acid biosynthesis glycosyltransferase
MKPIQKGIPRGIEVLLAAVGLIGLSPFLGLGALLVRLSSSGRVLFRQQRVAEIWPPS